MRGGPARDIYLSIDIDVVRQTEAPGASAPSVDGLGASEMLERVDWADRSFRIHAFDLCEVNPVVDRSGATARLAGHLAVLLVSATQRT